MCDALCGAGHRPSPATWVTCPARGEREHCDPGGAQWGTIACPVPSAPRPSLGVIAGDFSPSHSPGRLFRLLVWPRSVQSMRTASG